MDFATPQSHTCRTNVDSVRTLFSIVETVVPVLAVMVLLVTLAADYWLNRQLAAAALPSRGTRYLRWQASRMDWVVFTQFYKRFIGWFRRR